MSPEIQDGAQKPPASNQPHAPIDVVIRRLDSFFQLSKSERTLLASFASRAGDASRPAASLLLQEALPFPRPLLLLSGWAAQERVLPNGKRQLISLLLPGDAIGFYPPHRPWALASVRALTDVTLIDGEGLHLALRQRERYPGLAQAHGLAEAESEVFLLDQLVRLGVGSALERLSYLLLQLQHRCRRAGLCEDRRYPMPLSQDIIATLLGLSAVHVNRMFQRLREQRLIIASRGHIEIVGFEALAHLAHFRPPDLVVDRI